MQRRALKDPGAGVLVNEKDRARKKRFTEERERKRALSTEDRAWLAHNYHRKESAQQDGTAVDFKPRLPNAPASVNAWVEAWLPRKALIGMRYARAFLFPEMPPVHLFALRKGRRLGQSMVLAAREKAEGGFVEIGNITIGARLFVTQCLENGAHRMYSRVNGRKVAFHFDGARYIARL